MFEKRIEVRWNADFTDEERSRIAAKVAGIKPDEMYYQGTTKIAWLVVNMERLEIIASYNVSNFTEMLELLHAHGLAMEASIDTQVTTDAPRLRSAYHLWPEGEAQFEKRCLTVTFESEDDEFEDEGILMRETVAAIRAILREKVKANIITAGQVTSDCRLIEIVRDERLCDTGMMEE